MFLRTSVMTILPYSASIFSNIEHITFVIRSKIRNNPCPIEMN